MERRLTRARNKVTDARIPFRVPTDDLLVERLAGVLRVVYLVFNEGHARERAELRAEAIRLARLLVRLMPDEAEVHGLLALFLLTDARAFNKQASDMLERAVGAPIPVIRPRGWRSATGPARISIRQRKSPGMMKRFDAAMERALFLDPN